MRETAVFAYVVAVFIGMATVVFGFASLVENHADRSGLALIIGLATIGLLWGMANWIEKENS